MKMKMYSCATALFLLVCVPVGAGDCLPVDAASSAGQNSGAPVTEKTYDVRSDFSATQNPHGPWTYGWSDELSGPLHVYENPFFKTPSYNWGDAAIEASGAPTVAYNPHDVTMDLIPAHAMTIHPGPANQFSHCVWKAPAAGRYDIEASFTPLSTGGPHAYMLKNGVSIGDSLLPAGTPWSCSFKSMQLAAGDTIDAVVGVGNNGGYFNDLTQFSFTVTTDHGMRADETASAVVRQLKAPLREMIRQELQEALAGSAADHAINSFPVDAASSAWQNSGVRVNAGQHVLVEADKNEKWNLGQGLTDANGYSIVPPNAGTATYHTGTVNDDWHWGALICAVGNGRAEIKDPKHQMEIGTKRSFTAIGAGYLYFLCNDSPNLPDGGSGFDDNSGIIHVKVTVSDSACCAPPAIPATSALPSVTSTDGQNTTAN